MLLLFRLLLLSAKLPAGILECVAPAIILNLFKSRVLTGNESGRRLTISTQYNLEVRGEDVMIMYWLADKNK